jgi:hypothetical protein
MPSGGTMNKQFSLFIILLMAACGPVTPIPSPTSTAITPSITLTQALSPSETRLPAYATPKATQPPTPTFLPTEVKAGLFIKSLEIQGENLSAYGFLFIQGEDYSPFPITDPPCHSNQYNYIRINGDYVDIHETEPQPSSNGCVSVRKNNEEIYRIDTGTWGGYANERLVGLQEFQGRWILEIMHYEGSDFNYRGVIIDNGTSLREKFGYEDTFGFQILRKKPIFFFKKDGLYNLWYDGTEILTGYSEIYHYGYGDAWVLNPGCYETLLDFFGKRNGKWYYVQIR